MVYVKLQQFGNSWRPFALTALLFTFLAACATPQPGSKPHFKIGKPYQVDGRWYYPKEDPNYDRRGLASWYGDAFQGGPTANGEVFDKRRLSAAHKTLPLPSIVRVDNLENGRSITVRVNDRGPFVDDRIIDLSEAAARALGFENKGLARVRVRYLRPAELMAKAPRPGDKKGRKRMARREGEPHRGGLNQTRSYQSQSQSNSAPSQPNFQGSGDPIADLIQRNPGNSIVGMNGPSAQDAYQASVAAQPAALQLTSVHINSEGAYFKEPSVDLAPTIKPDLQTVTASTPMATQPAEMVAADTAAVESAAADRVAAEARQAYVAALAAGYNKVSVGAADKPSNNAVKVSYTPPGEISSDENIASEALMVHWLVVEDFRDFAEVDAAAKAFVGYGPMKIEPVEKNGELRHRLVIGPYHDLTSAEAWRKAAADAGYEQVFITSRLSQ